MLLHQKLLVLLFACFSILSASQVSGATPAQIDSMRDKALAYLFLSQEGDGFWDGPGRTDVQATSTVLEAFDIAGIDKGIGRQAGLSWLSNAHALSNNALAYQASALGLAGIDVSDKLTQLDAAKDGIYQGWGAYDGYQPSYPDTAIVHDAWFLSGTTNPNAGSTLGLIVNIGQNADGGWPYMQPNLVAPVINAPSRLIPTAITLRSLARFRTLGWGVDSQITAAINWLLSQQLGDGGFADDSSATTGNAYETALALHAIKEAQAAGNVAALAAGTPVDNASTFLLGEQLMNGSWSDDVITTAAVVKSFSSHSPTDSDMDGIPDSVEPLTGTEMAVADAHTLIEGIGQSVAGVSTAEVIFDGFVHDNVNVSLPSNGSVVGFTILAGRLPSGLTLNAASGALSGSATEAGNFNITYEVEYSDGSKEQRVVQLSMSVSEHNIPVMHPLMMLVLGLVLITIQRVRRTAASAIATLVIGIFALLPYSADVVASTDIPLAIAEEVNQQFAPQYRDRDGLSDDLNWHIEGLSLALDEAYSQNAQHMFAVAHKTSLHALHRKLSRDVKRRTQRLVKQQLTSAAESNEAGIRKGLSRLDSLMADVDALKSNDGKIVVSAFERLRSRLHDLQAVELPKRVVPTWRADEPGPALTLTPSKKIPAYVAADRRDQRERGMQMYAFNGDILMLAAAPSTPTEAASCSYTAADLADDGADVTITPEIDELAESLEYSTTRIFEYVANEIEFEPYFGALKGAHATLVTKTGSATDQSSLLIALLRASNIPARYVRGDVFSQKDMSPEDVPVNKWLKTLTSAAANSRLAAGQNPTVASNTAPEILRFAHVWVEACVPYAHFRGAGSSNAGHRWIPLDPSFETRRFETGVSVTQSFDFDAHLNSLKARLPHEVLENDVRAALSSPTESLDDVGYQSNKKMLELDILPASLPYHVETFTNWSNSGAPETATLPDSHRYFLKAAVKNSTGTALGASFSERLSDVVLSRITLSFDGAAPADQTAIDNWRQSGGSLPTGLNLVPVLRIDGSAVSTGTTSVLSETTNNQLEMWVTLDEGRTTLSGACVTDPSPVIVNASCFDTISASNYHSLQAYASQATPNVLENISERLVNAVNAQAQSGDNLDGTLGDYLYYMSLKYMGDTSDAAKRIGQVRGLTGDSGIHLGVTGSQSHVDKVLNIPFGIFKEGFYVDVPGGQSRSRDITTGASDFDSFVLAGYAASEYESFLWQENARLDAVSTIRGIQYASDQGYGVLTINDANRATQLPLLKTVANSPSNPLAYPNNFVPDVLEAQYLDQDFEVKIPDQRINYEGWEGYILVATKDTPTGQSASFPIAGGYAGGFTVGSPLSPYYNPLTGSGYQGATTNFGGTSGGTGGSSSTLPAVNSVGYGQNGNGIGPNMTLAGDPVNLVTGNFYHNERDIVIPHRDLPFVFERTYNSREPQNGPLGYGWTHSFNHKLRFLDEVPDGVEAGDDSDGTTSSIAWMDGSGAEKRVAVSGASASGVAGASFSNTQGHYFTFVREGDGSFTVTEKNGLRYRFEVIAGDVGQEAKLTQIVSRNDNTLTLTYSGSELDKVTDTTGRELDFTYTSGRITRIEDWTGRAQEYQYDGNGNLVQYLNPLAIAGSQNPVIYDYFTASDAPVIDHAIKSITLSKGNSLSFEYYVDGRVFRHTNSKSETFTFQYNDFRRETIVTDARGKTKQYFFNEYGNPVELIDEEKGRWLYEYTNLSDPYLRTAQVNAAGLRTEYDYNANGTLILQRNPSGNTVEYSDFTGFEQPGKIKDANGNYQVVKYDADGNVTDTIVLRAGVGAAINPSTYTPIVADTLAWSQSTYDTFGNRLSRKNVRDVATTNGFVQTWTYDANNLYTTQIERCGDKDGDGAVSDDTCDTAVLSHDSLGRMLQGVNGRFETVSFGYDMLNRVIRGTDALGYERDFGFDANGNDNYEGLTIDLNGIPTLIDSASGEYDEVDRQHVAVDAGGHATYFAYDAMGNVTSVTDPDNYRVDFEYDALGRVTVAKDEEGRTASRDLDIIGRVRALTDPNGNAQTFTYYDFTEDGRLEQRCDAVSRCTQFAYDNNGNVTTLTDNDGNTTLTTYDALNRPVRIVESSYTDAVLGSVRPVTLYTYDLLGNVTLVEAGYTSAIGTDTGADVVSTQRTSLYDDWSRTLSDTDALGRSWVYEYNIHSDRVRAEDPKGQITEVDYEYGGLLKEQRTFVSASDPNPHVVTYTRNALGQIVSVSAPEVDYQYGYDKAHRLASVTDSRGPATLSYDWSPGGLLQTLSDSNGHSLNYSYDPTGRLKFISTSDGETVGYTFDDAGRLVRKDYPGNVATTYSYYADDRVQDIATAVGSNPALHSQSLTYDTLGRRLSLSESLNGVATSRSYAYDPLSRLTSETLGGSTQSWEYDPFGNRRTHTQFGGAVDFYSHNAAHELTQVQDTNGAGAVTQRFSYDLNGNMERKCVGNVSGAAASCSADDVLALTYDALNRLTQASRTGIPNESYAYDYQGNRVAKTIGSATTQLHYDGLEIYQFVDSDWSNPTERFVHGAGLDEPLLHYTASQTLALQQNASNSVVLSTNASTGAHVGSQQFDAFGKVQTATGSIPQYGYTGREPDATGLTYYRARYYDSSIGRFTQRDPLGFIDGVNQYAYVRNNPVTNIDPMGTISQSTNNFNSLNNNYFSGGSSGISTQNLFDTSNGSNLGPNVELSNSLGFGERIGNAFNSLRQAGQDVVDNVVDFAGAVQRGLDFDKISELQDRAFRNEDIDPYSHQKAAYDYGAYVGNAAVAGTLRTASEFLYQFPKYAIEDIKSRISTGEPGDYQPYSLDGNGGIRDSFNDIQNTIDGANGSPISVGSGFYPRE